MLVGYQFILQVKLAGFPAPLEVRQAVSLPASIARAISPHNSYRPQATPSIADASVIAIGRRSR